MKISVIVPVFNVEEFLGICVESVISQTYSNYELILVNDGSTDGSTAICDQYCRCYPQHIKTIHLQNGGPLRARLLGIREATGDVLVFLDADDCLRKDALIRISECFCETNCDMLLYDAEQSAMFPSIQVKHPIKKGTVFENESKKDLYKKIILGEIPNSVWSKAIRRECTDFPEHFINYSARHGEDLLLSTCFISNSKKIVYLNEGLYYYRNRPGSAVHSFNVKRKESLKTVHTELEKYIDIWQMPELKPIHNARKVRGWVDNLKILFKNKKQMTKEEFRNELIYMAEDDYFRNAYRGMDKSRLSKNDSILSGFLYKRQYFLLSVFFVLKDAVKKL